MARQLGGPTVPGAARHLLAIFSCVLKAVVDGIDHDAYPPLDCIVDPSRLWLVAEGGSVRLLFDRQAWDERTSATVEPVDGRGAHVPVSSAALTRFCELAIVDDFLEAERDAAKDAGCAAAAAGAGFSPASRTRTSTPTAGSAFEGDSASPLSPALPDGFPMPALSEAPAAAATELDEASALPARLEAPAAADAAGAAADPGFAMPPRQDVVTAAARRELRERFALMATSLHDRLLTRALFIIGAHIVYGVRLVRRSPRPPPRTEPVGWSRNDCEKFASIEAKVTKGEPGRQMESLSLPGIEWQPWCIIQRTSDEGALDEVQLAFEKCHRALVALSGVVAPPLCPDPKHTCGPVPGDGWWNTRVRGRNLATPFPLPALVANDANGLQQLMRSTIVQNHNKKKDLPKWEDIAKGNRGAHEARRRQATSQRSPLLWHQVAANENIQAALGGESFWEVDRSRGNNAFTRKANRELADALRAGDLWREPVAAAFVCVPSRPGSQLSHDSRKSATSLSVAGSGKRLKGRRLRNKYREKLRHEQMRQEQAAERRSGGRNPRQNEPVGLLPGSLLADESHAAGQQPAVQTAPAAPAGGEAAAGGGEALDHAETPQFIVMAGAQLTDGARNEVLPAGYTTGARLAELNPQEALEEEQGDLDSQASDDSMGETTMFDDF